MAVITGGRLNTPRGQIAWVPVGPVARAYRFITENAKSKYRCLGVVGNWDHLIDANPGDHTPYSTHSITVGGRVHHPKKGFVYAIDCYVPEMDRFEKWFLGRLRAGHYKSVKYWNCLNRHWHRGVTRNGVPFARASWSADHHLHVSHMPGAEYSTDDYLGDYAYYLANGRNRGQVAESKPAAPKAKPVDAGARQLPLVRRGDAGLAVGLAQAALVAHGYLTPAYIDRKFGPGTGNALRKFQTDKGLPVTVETWPGTWDTLMPDEPPTIIRGSSGYYARLLQCLLVAHGMLSYTDVDGDIGDKSVAAIKRLQVTKKVPNSVVAGRGDGIAGTATWVTLLTV